MFVKQPYLQWPHQKNPRIRRFRRFELFACFWQTDVNSKAESKLINFTVIVRFEAITLLPVLIKSALVHLKFQQTCLPYNFY